MKRILPIFSLLALTSLFNHSVAADLKPGGIGFPSGAVKDADLLKLLYGNTLQTHSDTLGTDLFYYINKAGKVKLCAGGGISECDEAEWSIRGARLVIRPVKNFV